MPGFFRRLRARLKYRRFNAELKDELDVHRAMAEDELRVSGGAPDDVQRQAARQIGNVTLARESARGVWLAPWLESVWQDVRHAVQTLAMHRGFTVTAAAMLALGIGITTAMFTVVDALVFRPAPFREPDQLALVLTGNERGVRDSVVPAAIAKAWRESGAFEVVESARPWSGLLEAGDTVVERRMAAVTPGVFDMLGNVRPLHGRLFHEAEGQAGQADRVLISEAIWRTLYGADPALVGASITVDGERLTVVGVLAADFRFPEATTVLWRPADLNQAGESARPYVRFASGIPRDDALRIATDAARAVDARARQVNALALASPVAGLSDDYSTRAVPLLAGGVALVFLVLCANVSSLLLARLTTRRREFSMRAALGASRARLLRQALIESVALGTLSVAGGIGVAWALVSIARAFLPEPILQQTLNPLNIDGRGLLASSAAGLIATMAAGLLPAWLSTRADAGESLRVSGRSGTEPRGARVLTRTLLVTEVALACTLFVGAALLMRSFVNLANADKGLDTVGVTTAWLVLPTIESDPDDETTIRAALARSIEDDLRHLPGVQRLAWSYGIPPEGGFQDDGTWIADEPGAVAASMHLNHYVVSSEFFPVYRIPILKGRSFNTSDGFRDVVVGEHFARALWQDVDPVGRTFRNAAQVQKSTMQPGPQATYRVIGVARELRYPSIDSNSGFDGPEIYHPYTPAGTPMVSLRCEPTCDTAAIRHRLASTHSAVRVQRATITAERYAREIVRPRASAALAVTFAAIAIAAAAGGLLSVLSYAVSRRRREFGIRLALGASPGQIHRTVLRDGLVVAASGLAIGSILAAATARAITSLQYGVTSADPLSWATVLGAIAATAVVASWGPARAAARVDPAVLLREE